MKIVRPLTPLRQRMLEDLQIRNYSPHTVDAYLRSVAQFAKHFRTSPDRLGAEHIRTYQLHLLHQQVSESVFIQTVCALRFFYETTLVRPWMVEYIPYPKKPKTLPVILSRDEVKALLLAPRHLKHRVILATLYATGVRVSELCQLQGTDIDSKRMVIHVRQGKGNKDRDVTLSPRLLEVLAPTGDGESPRSIYSPVTNAVGTNNRSVQRRCGTPSGKPVDERALRRRYRHIFCDTVGRRTCWNVEPI